MGLRRRRRRRRHLFGQMKRKSSRGWCARKRMLSGGATSAAGTRRCPSRWRTLRDWTRRVWERKLCTARRAGCRRSSALSMPWSSVRRWSRAGLWRRGSGARPTCPASAPWRGCTLARGIAARSGWTQSSPSFDTRRARRRSRNGNLHQLVQVHFLVHLELEVVEADAHVA